MQRTIFDSLDELNTKPTPYKFEPVGDQSTKLDAATELAAFIGRPDRAESLEPPKETPSSEISCSTNLSPFAEAAGLYGPR